MEKRLTESDSTSTDLGQALLDLQSQLEEVIQDFESETGEELSGEAEERRRVRITSLRESLKNDLDELQNQVALRVSQLEDRLSLLEIVIEGKNHFDSAPVGHVVQGSPAPSRNAILRSLAQVEYATLIPLLMSVGHLQNEVLEDALAFLPANQLDRVSYTPDAILPDPELQGWIVQESLEALRSVP